MQNHGIKPVEIWIKGVDTKRFSPDSFCIDMRDKLSNHEPKNKILLYAGRLAAEKKYIRYFAAC